MHFLRLKDVIATTGLAKSTIYALIKKDKFPKPVRLTLRSVGWRSDELQRWASSLPYSDGSE